MPPITLTFHTGYGVASGDCVARVCSDWPLAQVWVIRTLRARADRPAVKQGKDIPTVSLQELLAPRAFGRMSIGLDPNEIPRLLREE